MYWISFGLRFVSFPWSHSRASGSRISVRFPGASSGSAASDYGTSRRAAGCDGFPQRVRNEVRELEFMETIDESRTVWQSIDNIVGMERSLDALWGAVADELDAIGTDAAMTFVEDEAGRSSSNGARFR